jgi:hypothetical protein
MTKHKEDMEADIKAAEDRGEPISLMEPLLIGEGSRHRAILTDLALELAQRSAGFRHSLPESLLVSVASLVRSMNCYYSNLIEGHDTRPVDIERAPRLVCAQRVGRSGCLSSHDQRGPSPFHVRPLCQLPAR